MRALQYNSNTDDMNCLMEVQVDKPTAKPGYLVVKVKAASVNPIDYKVMGGYLKGAGWSMPLPFTMGYDFSGVVDEAGEGSGFAVGDEVFAVNWGNHKHDENEQPVGGAFAEYICVPTSKVSRKPANVSFEQAAAVALVGTTAHQCVNKISKVTSGSHILVLGGSSGVGSVAIQLAKAKGASVATTCSSRTFNYVAQFEPDLILDYHAQQWEKNPVIKDLDAVIDTVGEANGFSRARENGTVKSDGVFVSIADFEAGVDPSAHPPLSFAAFYCLCNDTNVQDELAEMLAKGTLQIPIDKSVKFNEKEVRELLEYQRSGQSMGKNVIVF